MAEKASIQVIGVGLPRTGTTSLQQALLILGFDPCHHMTTDVLEDSFPYRKGRRWLPVFTIDDKAQRQSAIRSIFDDGGFKATVDFPPSSFPEDLIEIYPEAKVILSLQKSPEAWRASFDVTIGLCRTPWHVATNYLLPMSRMLVQPLCKEWDKLNQDRFGCQIYCTSSTELYTRHNDWIRKIVPKERLLEHRPSEGWESLCKFLNVAVPDMPYPRLNEREPLRRWFFKLAAIGIAAWICLFAMIIGLYHVQYR